MSTTSNNNIDSAICIVQLLSLDLYLDGWAI